MARDKDITGWEVNDFTVLYRTDKPLKNRSYVWKCRCICGNEFELPTPQITSRKTKSCGCANRKRTRRQVHGHTSGARSSKTYTSWANMKRRCLDPQNNKYRIYGERGIRVCESWLNFNNFLNDMGEKPEGKTLERSDVNGDYCKENCVWASPKEQANNKRCNHIVSFDNMEKTVSQWSDYFGIPFVDLRMRLHRGWDFERAVTQPLRGSNV